MSSTHLNAPTDRRATAGLPAGQPRPVTGGVSRRIHRVIATGTLIGALLGGALIPATGTAQDGTEGATPVPPSDCGVPLAAESYDEDEMSPDVATPMATPEATPVTGEATPIAAGEPEEAVDPLQEDLAASSAAIAACLTEGNADILADMISDTYRGQLIGGEEPLEADLFASILPTLPETSYTILGVEDVMLESDTLSTATITYQIANQIRMGTWEFERTTTDAGEAWTLAQETPLSANVPPEATPIDVTISDLSYDLSETTVDAGAVVMNVTNEAATDHEILLLQLSGSAATSDVVQSPGPTLPDGVTFAGQVTIPAGTDGTLVLTDLEPGAYALVDLFLQDDGTTNLSNGMEATLTVE